jgi:hypothetical protein
MNGFKRQRLDEPGDRDQRNWKRRLGYYCRKMVVMERRAVVVIGNSAAIGVREPVPAEKHLLRRAFGRKEKRFRDMEPDILDKEEQQQRRKAALQRGPL